MVTPDPEGLDPYLNTPPSHGVSHPTHRRYEEPVYDYDVYVGLDGAPNPGRCVTLSYDPGRTDADLVNWPLNGVKADLVTPGWWPVDQTGTCHVSGTITLTGSSREFTIAKEIRDNSDQLFESPESPIKTTDGDVEYRLTFANVGSDALSDVVMYDMLPAPGDKGTVGSWLDKDRGSTTRAMLTEEVAAPVGYTVAYSTAAVPCRPQVNASIPNCEDDWSSAAPTDLADVTAIRITADNGTTLRSGDNVRASVKVSMTDDSQPGSLAWNSLSAVAGGGNDRPSMSPVETQSVGAQLLREVTPVAPVLVPAVGCGVEATLSIPGDTDSVTYSASRVGDTVTVTVSVADGFVLAEGAKDRWEFEIPAVEQCPPDVVAVTPVAPTVTQATCPAPGEATLPAVVLATTTGVAYAVVGDVKVGNTVSVEARAASGYRLTAAEGWTIADGVGTYPVKLNSIDCQKPPTGGLPNTGVNLPPFLWWGAGASLLLGVALVLGSRVRAGR